MTSRLNVVILTLLLGLVAVIGTSAGNAWALQVAEFGEEGFLNIDYQGQARAGIRDQGPDPTQDQTTRDMYMRRNRLSFIGAINETFGFNVQFEYNGGAQLGSTSVRPTQGEYGGLILDHFITMNFTDTLKFRVGKTKHILTREVNEGCFDPLSIDRSDFVLGPFSSARPEKTTRDYGVVAWGNMAENKLQYKLSVMQGNDYGSNKPDGIGYRYSGRVHLTLLDPEAGPVYRGTYLGKKKVLTVGAGYETQPDAVFSDATSATPTGAEDYKAFTYDLFYEKPTDMGTFTLSGAYLEADFNNAGLRGVKDAEGANGEKNGSYWKAGYMLGKVQFYGRLEDWSFASLNGVFAQGIDLTAAGVNYYIKGQDLRLTLERSVTDFKTENARNRDFRTILAQLQLIF